MNLLDSLLDAIVRLDGDALVMHVGEKPYVVTTSEALSEFRGPLAWGQVELSSRVLTPRAVNGVLAQILPIDQRVALDEYGATEFPVTAHASNKRFTIVAARGGDDIWLEVRRLPSPVAEQSAQVEREDVDSCAPEHDVIQPVVSGRVPVPAPAVDCPPPPPHASVAATSSGPGEHAAHATAHIAPSHAGPVRETPREQELHTERRAAAAEDEPLLPDEDLALQEEALIEDREWGDDVMTEGDLGELLRASAVAALTGGAGQRIEDAAFLHEQQAGAPSSLDRAPTAGAAVPDADEPLCHPAEDVRSPSSDAAGTPSAAVSALELPAAAQDAPVAREAMSVELTAGGGSSASADDTDPATLAREALLAGQEELWARHASHEGAAESDALLSAERAGAADLAPAHSTGVVELAEGPTEEGAFADRAVLTVDRPEVTAAPSYAAADAHGVDASTTRYRADETEEPVEEELGQPAATHDGAAMSQHEEPARADIHEDEAEAAARRPAAVVLPLTRHGRADAPADARGGVGTLERVLRLAAARGAAAVYFVAQSAPMVRVDGEFGALEGEPIVGTDLVERLAAELRPPGHEAAGSTPAEWLMDVPEIGRVRCMSFRDHRGPGLICRMVPQRAIAADKLGLPAEVQALCSEADGLVLVAGARGSGRSTLLTSFVDLINRTRSDHVITAGPQIEFVHENKRSFISQREIRGDSDAVAAAVRAACREDPDVLIIEDARNAELATLAIEAAEAGRLVFASVPGVSAASAIERLIEMFPPERREKVQASLAGTLRGVIAQVLLRKLRGGRVAAREVLFNTPDVAGLIREGKTFQLPAVLESGRRHGMMPFAESLAALVKDGAVHPAHACRRAPNRDQFMALLRRDGVDTSLAERLA